MLYDPNQFIAALLRHMRPLPPAPAPAGFIRRPIGVSPADQPAAQVFPLPVRPIGATPQPAAQVYPPGPIALRPPTLQPPVQVNPVPPHILPRMY